MSPAYSPDTGYFYFEAVDGCAIQIKAKQTFQPGGHPFHATGSIEGPSGPLQTYIRAVGVTTGKTQWEYKLTGARMYGAGLVSTAGGLIFGGSPEGSFLALDAATGKELWNFNTGATIKASPITYEVKGQQYIAIAAGSNVLAFGLFNGGNASQQSH
jgi:alcohol dehydrogenase (cytochrome c)